MGLPLAHVHGRGTVSILDHIKACESSPLAYGLEMANGGMTMINKVIRSFPGRHYMMGD